MNDFKKFYKSKFSGSYDPYSNYIERTYDMDMSNKMMEDRIILLTSDIDSYVSNVIKCQLLYLDQQSNEPIKLYIDSGGGEIYTGMGLIDVMEYIKSDIETVNIGLAASMAAVILASGTQGKRKSLKRSRVMIHQPLGGFSGYTQASDMEIDTKEILSLKKELYQILADRTSQSYDKVSSDGDRDYWMNSKEAMEYGIVDEIVSKKI
jgi:ATP-dependent Clp protease protease subunit